MIYYYNIKKAVCMCAKQKICHDLFVPPVILKRKPLRFVTVQKYLGVLINTYFNNSDDVKRRTVQATYL